MYMYVIVFQQCNSNVIDYHIIETAEKVSVNCVCKALAFFFLF